MMRRGRTERTRTAVGQILCARERRVLFPKSDPSEATRRREARCVAGETREHTVECFAYVAYFKQGRADGIVAPRVAAETPARKNQTNRETSVVPPRRSSRRRREGLSTAFVTEDSQERASNRPNRAAQVVVAFYATDFSFTNTLDTIYGTGRGLMSQISFAYWSMVRSELNLPEKAVEMMEDSVQPASFLYAASTFAWHSM